MDPSKCDSQAFEHDLNEDKVAFILDFMQIHNIIPEIHFENSSFLFPISNFHI